MPNVMVRPNSPGNTHDVSISGLGRTYGIKLERGAKSIIEAPLTPSNIMKTGGVKKYGDFDPAFATIEMRTWEGGRGGEFLSDDPTKYFDGYGWTLSPGVWHQAPQWTWGEGYYNADSLMPGSKRRDVGNSMKWHPLVSTNHIARSFVDQGTGHTMKRVQSWVRKIGTPPAPLIARVHVGFTSGGLTTDKTRPGTSAGSMAGFSILNSTSCESLESFVWEGTLTTVVSVTADPGTSHPTIDAGGTDQASSGNYWVSLHTSAAGTDANHWEIGYNSSAAGNGSTSLAGAGTSAAWAASTINFYLRAIPEPLRRKWHFFSMDKALYAADERKKDGSSFRIYINGDRGIGSSDEAMTTALFKVHNKTTVQWPTDIWAGATLAILRGPGAGQESLITGNDSTGAGTGYLEVSLNTAGTSLSEYVIYDTNEWRKISSAIVSSVGNIPVTDVAEGNQIAYLAFGSSHGGSTHWIRQLTWETTKHAIKVTSQAMQATYITVFNHPIDGPTLYGAVSSAGKVRSGAATTDFTFTAVDIECGGSGYSFTNILDYNNQIYAFKEDSIWGIISERAAKVNVGLDAFASSNNGRAAIAQNLSLYFSWSHSVERLSGGVVDDIGPWKGAGMKPGHQGPVSCLVPVIAWTLGGIDAGTTGQSCMMAWNGRGWHEIYRAHSTGYPVENAYFQSNPGGRPRLWMSVGGDMVSMQFPKDTLNPRNDKSIHYQHEAVLETATIDMDAVQLKKLFGKVYANTQNLASSQARIYAEYQLDDTIGSTQWTPLGAFSRSPIDHLNIRRGNKHALRMRYRGLTENSTVPAEMHAAVVKAVARTPVRRQWTIRAVTGDFQVDAQGLEDSNPDDFYLWLQDVSVSAEPLLMRSAWEAMDNVYVYAEHPVLSREYTTPDGYWGGNLQMVIREIEE